jgi:hypothetical protein
MPDQAQAGTTQTDVLKSWNDIQRRIWNNWAALADPKRGWSADGAMKESLQILEDSLAQTIRDQAEWNRQCLKALHLYKGALPPPLQAPYEQMEHLVDQWAAMQQAVAKTWVNALTDQQPAGWNGGVDLTRGVIETWNDMQQRWNSENVWMRMLHGASASGSAQSESEEAASSPAAGSEADEQPRRGKRQAA